MTALSRADPGLPIDWENSMALSSRPAEHQAGGGDIEQFDTAGRHDL